MAAAALCLALHAMPSAPGAALRPDIANSVVKVYVTQQREDYTLPWQSGPTLTGTGSGFVIAKRRILTNAHIVSDARFIQVQKNNDPRLYRARVTFQGHDCDLATLSVDEPDFFEGTEPARFARELPRLNDEVVVLGYPLGGTLISVTRGVVSRIDYGVYAHSGVDQHLVLQVDAAINPGNSGGPILYKGRVVGLAFQGLSWAENIGYAIPFPVIQHFLSDIADSRYNGYPELGVQFMDLRNPALRRSLAVPRGEAGVVAQFIDPFGSAPGYLQPGDVLLGIDGHPIAEDGTVKLDGTSMLFAELLERKQWGESVELRVWRAGAASNVEIPLTNPPDPFTLRSRYDQRPEYYVKAGLVFCPLTREYLRAVERNRASPRVQQLFYYSEFAKPDGLYQGRDAFVVLIRRLPHAVNTYADAFLNGIVDEVNGVKVRGLRDLKHGLDSRRAGFDVIRFAGLDDTLVLDAEAADAADADIAQRYGVAVSEYLGDQP